MGLPLSGRRESSRNGRSLTMFRPRRPLTERSLSWETSGSAWGLAKFDNSGNGPSRCIERATRFPSPIPSAGSGLGVSVAQHCADAAPRLLGAETARYLFSVLPASRRKNQATMRGRVNCRRDAGSTLERHSRVPGRSVSHYNASVRMARQTRPISCSLFLQTCQEIGR